MIMPGVRSRAAVRRVAPDVRAREARRSRSEVHEEQSRLHVEVVHHAVPRSRALHRAQLTLLGDRDPAPGA